MSFLESVVQVLVTYYEMADRTYQKLAKRVADRVSVDEGNEGEPKSRWRTLLVDALLFLVTIMAVPFNSVVAFCLTVVYWSAIVLPPIFGFFLLALPVTRISGLLFWGIRQTSFMLAPAWRYAYISGLVFAEFLVTVLFLGILAFTMGYVGYRTHRYLTNESGEV